MTSSEPIKSSLVEKAIDLYLGIAYPQTLPSRVRTIITNMRDRSHNYFDNPAFIKTAGKNGSSYCLRLGNAFYPHMKLLIESMPNGSAYFFRVDAHDAHIVVPPDHAEYGVFRKMCEKNRIIAESIEDAWRLAGLPTFTSRLAEELGYELLTVSHRDGHGHECRC